MVGKPLVTPDGEGYRFRYFTDCFYYVCHQGRVAARLSLRNSDDQKSGALIPFGTNHKPHNHRRGRWVASASAAQHGLVPGAVYVKSKGRLVRVRDDVDN